MPLIYSLNKNYQTETYIRESDQLLIDFIKNNMSLQFDQDTKNKILIYASERLQKKYQEKLKNNTLQKVFISKNLFENYDILNDEFYNVFNFIQQSKRTYQELSNFIDQIDENVILTDIIVVTDTDKPESVFYYYKFVGMNWQDNDTHLYSKKLKSNIFVNESVRGAFISKLSNFDFNQIGGFSSGENQIRGYSLPELFKEYEIVLR